VLAVMLAGDTINGKSPVCARVTKALGNGYAGVYHLHIEDMGDVTPPAR